LEELWLAVDAKRDEKEEVQFRKMLADARNLAKQENVELTLEIFESTAEEISAGKKVSTPELAKCEEAGFGRITNLLGSEFAKLEIPELQRLLNIISFGWNRLIGEELLEKLEDNAMDIYPFELQLNRNREVLLSRNDLRKCPGIFSPIFEILKFVSK